MNALISFRNPFLFLSLFLFLISSISLYSQDVEVISNNDCSSPESSEVHVVDNDSEGLFSDLYPSGQFTFILSNPGATYTQSNSTGVFLGTPNGSGYFVIVHDNVENSQYQCPSPFDIITDDTPQIEVELLTEPTCPDDSVLYQVTLICGFTGTPTYHFYNDENVTLSNLTGLFSDVDGGYFYATDSDGTPSNVVYMDSPYPFEPLGLNPPIVTSDCDSIGASTIQAEAVGGDGNYTYYLIEVATGNSEQSMSGLFSVESGSYYIGVNDGTGCSHQCPQLIVVEECCEIGVGVDVVICPDNSSNAMNGATLTFSLSGGQAPYTITDDLLINEISQAGDPISIQNIEPGTYTYTITDASGCSQTETVIVDAPEDYGVEIIDYVYDCSIGLVDVTVEFSGYNPDGGGYYIMGLGTTDSPIYTFTGMTPGEEFSGVICPAINLEQCPGNVSFSAPDSLESFNVEVDVLVCPDNSNNPTNGGTITFSFDGGQAPYTVSGGFFAIWTSQNGEPVIVENVQPGTYTYTITDDSGCSQTETVVVDDAEDYGVEVIGYVYDCSTGLVDVTVEFSGYNPDGGGYFIWSGGTVDAIHTFTGMMPGELFSTTICPDITLEQCPGTISFTVPDSLESFGVEVDVVICPDNSNNSMNGGTITFSFNGNQAPYILTDGMFVNEISQTGESIVIENLEPGTYAYTITDASGCSQTETVIVDDPEDYGVEVIDYAYDCSTGLVDVTVEFSGYNPDGGGYFIWSGGTVDAIHTFTGMTPGELFSTTICPDISLEQCPGTISFIVPDSLESFEVNTNVVICPDNSNNSMDGGTITFSFNGGQAPYVLTDGVFINEISQIGDPISIQNIEPGTYTYTITDASGCSQTETVIVDDPEDYGVEIIDYLYDCATGLVDVTVEFSGYNPDGNGYYIMGVGTTDSPVYTFTGMSPGLMFTGTICPAINLEQCPGTISFVAPDSLESFIVETNVSICPSNSNNAMDGGSISFFFSGGQAPYIVTDGMFTNEISQTGEVVLIENVQPGTYTYTITDASGCSQTEVVVVEELEDYGVEIIDYAYDCSTGLVDVTVEFSGYNPDGEGYFIMGVGTTDSPIYTFTGMTPGETFSGIICPSISLEQCPGTISFTAPDSLGTFEVEVETFICPENASSGSDLGSVTVSFYDGEAPYTVTDGVFFNGISQTGEPVTFSGVEPGTYVYTISDASGCTQLQTVVVEQPEDYYVEIIDYVYDCTSGLVDVTVQFGGYNPDGGGYYWMGYGDVDVIETFVGLTPGETVSGIFCPSIYLEQCPGYLSFEVPYDTATPLWVESIEICASDSTDYAYGANVILEIYGGAAPYTIIASNGGVYDTYDSVFDAGFFLNGVYDFIVTDANGCTHVVTSVVDCVVPLILFSAKGTFNMFPNPIMERTMPLSFVYELEDNDKTYQIVITEASTGREVSMLQLDNQQAQMELNIDRLSKGIYIATLYEGDKKVLIESKRFIVHGN